MNYSYWPRTSILICGTVIAFWNNQIDAQTKVVTPPEPVDVLPVPTVEPGFGIPEGLRSPITD